MNTLNKNLLMGGVAACAVAFASCGDKKESAATGSDTEKAPATSTDGSTATAEKTETVSINLSGLK